MLTVSDFFLPGDGCLTSSAFEDTPEDNISGSPLGFGRNGKFQLNLIKQFLGYQFRLFSLIPNTAVYRILEFSVVEGVIQHPVDLAQCQFVSGAVGEATLVSSFSEFLRFIGIFGLYYETLAFIFIIGTITYLSTVIGELVPKRLAIRSPEDVAAFTAPFMNGLLGIAMPVVRVLSLSSELILRLFGVKNIPPQAI